MRDKQRWSYISFATSQTPMLPCFVNVGISQKTSIIDEALRKLVTLPKFVLRYDLVHGFSRRRDLMLSICTTAM